MAQPVFRFAPSPNGRLHLGHAYSALLNEKMAREAGGRMLLRIEDTDTIRCRPEYAQAVISDLDWLGIRFETPVRRQSAHIADYRAALDRLARQGLLYSCSCTRALKRYHAWALVDPEGQPLYAQTCRLHGARAGEPQALRIMMDKAVARLDAPLFKRENGGDWIVDPTEWGDVVLARKDTGTSYHLSCVVDDAIQGVTHVVRGKDMQAATSIHRLLQELLGLPHPVYHHHDLIMFDEHRKLSKSHSDMSLSELRAQGTSPARIRQQLGF